MVLFDAGSFAPSPICLLLLVKLFPLHKNFHCVSTIISFRLGLCMYCLLVVVNYSFRHFMLKFSVLHLFMECFDDKIMSLLIKHLPKSNKTIHTCTQPKLQRKVFLVLPSNCDLCFQIRLIVQMLHNEFAWCFFSIIVIKLFRLLKN